MLTIELVVLSVALVQSTVLESVSVCTIDGVAYRLGPIDEYHDVMERGRVLREMRHYSINYDRIGQI